MTWEIVIGIIALFGFITAIVKTVVPLTNAMALLTERINSLTECMEKMMLKNSEAHGRLWGHNREQDKLLQEHGQRLHDLDGK